MLTDHAGQFQTDSEKVHVTCSIGEVACTLVNSTLNDDDDDNTEQ